MTECDDCGTEVRHVWRHRAFDSETKRTLRWVCPTCHPELPSELTTELGTDAASADGPTTTAEEGSTPELRSDGGVATAAPATEVAPAAGPDSPGRFACPICSGETVNGQCMYDCTDCGWTGPR